MEVGIPRNRFPGNAETAIENSSGSKACKCEATCPASCTLLLVLTDDDDTSGWLEEYVSTGTARLTGIGE